MRAIIKASLGMFQAETQHTSVKCPNSKSYSYKERQMSVADVFTSASEQTWSPRRLISCEAMVPETKTPLVGVLYWPTEGLTLHDPVHLISANPSWQNAIGASGEVML